MFVAGAGNLLCADWPVNWYGMSCDRLHVSMAATHVSGDAWQSLMAAMHAGRATSMMVFVALLPTAAWSLVDTIMGA